VQQSPDKTRVSNVPPDGRAGTSLICSEIEEKSGGGNVEDGRARTSLICSEIEEKSGDGNVEARENLTGSEIKEKFWYVKGVNVPVS